MDKIVAVATVLAVLGGGVIGYSLVRTGGQIGRLTETPAPREEAARVRESIPPPIAAAAPGEAVAEGEH